MWLLFRLLLAISISLTAASSGLLGSQIQNDVKSGSTGSYTVGSVVSGRYVVDKKLDPASYHQEDRSLHEYIGQDTTVKNEIAEENEAKPEASVSGLMTGENGRILANTLVGLKDTVNEKTKTAPDNSGSSFVDIVASNILLPSSARKSMTSDNTPTTRPIAPFPTPASPVLIAPIVKPTVPVPGSTSSEVKETFLAAEPAHLAPVVGKSSSGEEFCEFVDGNCAVCAPFRSPDYCKEGESFSAMIQARTNKIRGDPQSVTDDGYWFHYLEDKVAAYLLSAELNIATPEMFCCITDVNDWDDCLETKIPSANVDGVVIKATNFRSTQGVYVLIENPDPTKSGTVDLLTGMPMSYSEVFLACQSMQATKIIVEEFVGNDLPTAYKFHIMNGVVEAIDVIANRGSGDCPCYGVVDVDFRNRLDRFGCFEPGGLENVEVDTGCTSIDFTTGRRKAGTVKQDLYLCDDIYKPSDCLMKEMTEIALKVADRIGVYMRIDMFVAGGKVYMQEYTANHMNGLRHCAAKYDEETECIDSCFMGRAWNEAGGLYGGVSKSSPPAKLEGFLDLTPQQQCDLLIGVQVPSHESHCTTATTLAPAPRFLR